MNAAQVIQLAALTVHRYQSKQQLSFIVHLTDALKRCLADIWLGTAWRSLIHCLVYSSVQLGVTKATQQGGKAIGHNYTKRGSRSSHRSIVGCVCLTRGDRLVSCRLAHARPNKYFLKNIETWQRNRIRRGKEARSCLLDALIIIQFIHTNPVMPSIVTSTGTDSISNVLFYLADQSQFFELYIYDFA